ncbi:hypothetical protein V6N13_032886 [Hibiscus sabdariffa]
MVCFISGLPMIGVQGLSGMVRQGKASLFVEAANKVHEHVCLEIVVVTQSLDRKLHAFDVLFEYDGAKWNCYRTIAEMQRINGSFGHEWSWPSLTGLQSEKLHHGPLILGVLGYLIYEIFSGMKLGETEELRHTSSIPKPLHPDYQRLLSSMPSRRLNTSKLIDNSEFFQNKLVDTIHFMEILGLKDSVGRDTFFRKLPTLAEQLPCQIVLNKIFPLLTL